jgi:precorrin-6Y C5,15-methyltransferase (decarboxylating)
LVVGIGEDGVAGLSPAARAALDDAEVLVGGGRHLGMLPPDRRERHAWPKGVTAMVDRIEEMRGRRVCVLATGDPMHFGIGATLAERFPAEEMRVVPNLSAFALAASRLAWPLEQAACLSLHGRAIEALALHIAPGARLIVLTSDGETPRKIAAELNERGFGKSRMIALAHMGGPKESFAEATAESWDHDVADFHTLAVECVAGPDAVWYPRTGLPDDAFVHDGKLTKREFRVLALAKLMPQPGGLLWDIGAGCGSVAIEWMRAADRAHAIALEPLAERREMILRNAARLGVPTIEVVDGRAPGALSALPSPDAVFVGGGLSEETTATVADRLKSGGRLVAHAVTLESEALLLAAYAERGGETVRLSAERAEPVGTFSAWRPAMPIVQWSWRKP